VGEESHIIRALETLYRGRFRHLLVHGKKHVMVGIISIRDILKMGVGLQHYLVEDKALGSIVGKKQLKVDIQDPVHKAVRLMLKENRGSVAVLSDGKLKRIFTERDILRRVAVKKMDIKKTPMRKVMTANPVSVNIPMPIGEVLSRMYEGDFRNMPVFGLPVIWRASCPWAMFEIHQGAGRGREREENLERNQGGLGFLRPIYLRLKGSSSPV
jgi:CBS-domain-containing membrane protein